MTPFASRAYRILWSSTLASATAQGMERTATAWLALETGSGAFAIGLIFAARMLPSLLLGLIAGTIADRADRPRQLLAVAAATVFVMAAFGWIAGGGQIQLWQLVAFSFAAGTMTVFDMPARQALVLDTVPRPAAPRALALNALAARIAAAGGAIFVGVLISNIGISNSYYVIAVTYALMGALVTAIHVNQNRNTIVTPPPFRKALREATRLIVDQPGVRTLFIAGLVCEIFAFSFSTALPIFSQEVLAVDATGLGTMNAAVSIGGALAVIVLTLLPNEMPRKPLLSAIFLAYGVALIIFSSTQTLLGSSTILLLIGFCAAAFDVLQQTLIQLAVPDEQRGRAVGVWILGIGSAPIGHLEMGALAALLGVSAALLINGTLTLISALALLVRAPAYRWSRLRNDGAKDGAKTNASSG